MDREAVDVRTLAATLSAETALVRLRRIGEQPPEHFVPFDQLPEDDQQQWTDLATAVLSSHVLALLNVR